MKTTKELKPILIFEDVIQIKTDLHYLDKRILPNVPPIQRAFESLNLAEISDKYLHDILYNSSKEIEREMIIKTKSEVTHQLQQTDAVNKAVAAVDKLRKLATDLREKYCKHNAVETLLIYLSVSENGNIVFSSKAKEELKETYRHYAGTATGIAKRKLHEEAVTALNKFKKAMHNEDVLEYFDIDANDLIMPVPIKYE